MTVHWNELVVTDALVSLLLLNHSVKQLTWIELIVPEHLHGDINGLSFVRASSSPKHILHTNGV